VWCGTPPPPAPTESCPTTAFTAPAPSAAAVLVSAPLLAPVSPTPIPVDWFMLPPIKYGSDYLQTWDLILFWLRCPSFSTVCSDTVLNTDAANSLVSQYWEGQLRMAVQDGLVQFLFDNTGDIYYGCRFEIAFLEAIFCPNTFSRAFAALISLVNNT
jgi:hypothetical protein